LCRRDAKVGLKRKSYFISIAYRENNLEKSLVKSPKLAKWPDNIWLEFKETHNLLIPPNSPRMQKGVRGILELERET
jgi:hypothetical protein